MSDKETIHLVSEFSRFCAVEELLPDGKKAAKINGVWVLVCYSGERLFAVSNICSHQTKPTASLPARCMGLNLIWEPVKH